jgi:hypothetical protein
LRAAFASIKPALLLLGQERDEIGELLGRQIAVRLRHHVLVSGLDVRARIRDRGLDERGERALVRLFRVLGELVEIGANLPVRARRLERMAAAAAVCCLGSVPLTPAAVGSTVPS